MNDLGRMSMQHWAGFDCSHLKDCLKDHPAMKLMDVQSQRDAAFAERDTAMAEKRTAFAERDAALLQRDLAYADRNAAWMDRDATLAVLAMLRVGKENYVTSSKSMQIVSDVPVPCENANSQGAQKANTVHGKEQGKNRTGKSIAAAGQTNKEHAPQSKRKRKQRALQDVITKTGSKKDLEGGNGNKVSDMKMPFSPSDIPHPYCSCTGSYQQCYRWGKGGWQSACCTNFLSMYPLPMSETKRSARVPGRKMSGGAFNKVLERLAREGVDISVPVDLKNYWAKHGTNRFITIK